MTVTHGLSPDSSSPDVMKRPKGILKNSGSFQPSPISPPHSNTSFPSLPDSVENKELTLQNTLQNAGRRRSSSGVLAHRLSGGSHASDYGDENGSRLKWDEANLYLTEQEKTAKMKIEEPKTPWAPHYDPVRDEENEGDLEAQTKGHMLDVQDLVVDELDKNDSVSTKVNATRDRDIPDLELGEPEEDVTMRDTAGDMNRITRERSLSGSGGEKHVMVDNDSVAGGSESDHLMTTEETREKHKQFEERRKKHYEMKNIKDLLGHPENLDDIGDEDGDGNEDTAELPAVPRVPSQYVNGTKT